MTLRIQCTPKLNHLGFNWGCCSAVNIYSPQRRSFIANRRQIYSVKMPKSRLWTKFTEIIWDGLRSREEKLLVQKLDLFLMTWATYGYFVRLLDSYNVTNAYVSGMKEDLNVKGDDYNLFTTFFNVGYICSQVPSQLLLTRIRPSYYLPTAELIWSVVTFCFAAVQTVEQVFALRFLIGVFEAPFAVGVVTVMGNYYTPRELAKRIAIFYSAAYVASMFSGYLQAAIYKGLNGHLGLAGWRWLFIFCGIISLPGAFYGYYAIPDTPYRTRAPWIKPEDRLKYIERMETVKRSPPVRLSWRKIRKVVTHWPIYAFTLTLIAHCVATQPLNYLPVWLKSLNRFSVYQINLLPTAAQGLALVTTLGYAWTSDYLNTPSARWQIMLVPAVLDLLGMLCVLIPAATTPADQQQPFGVTFFGYFINACSWGYWPLVFSWINEICRDDAEERAIVIGVCQTVGLAFTAWLPVVVLNVGKYAPRFTLGFAVMTGFSVLELLNVFILRACARWEAKKKQREGHSVDDERMEDSEEAAVIVVGPGVPDPLVMVEK